MSDATQHPKSGSLIEWVMPLAFIAAAAWLTWHMPAFILDFGGPNDQLSALYASLDLTPNLHTPLTPNADLIDWTALSSSSAHAPCAARRWSSKAGAPRTAPRSSSVG